MSAEAEHLRSRLESLLTDEMGWVLRFPYHEDGSAVQPFVWDEAAQGSLTALNLLRSHNWLQPLEEAQILEKWLKPEQVGAVNGEKWLIPDQDSAGILIDPATQAARQQQYEVLLQTLQSELADRQTWELSYDEAYKLVVLLGRVAASEQAEAWIGLAPVVPIATPDTHSPIALVPTSQPTPSRSDMASSGVQFPQRIQTQIDRLGHVQIYGYYGGGYGQIHDHYLVQAVGDNADLALERTLIQAGCLTIGQFGGFSPDASTDQLETPRIEQLNQFLQHQFTDCQVYHFHFWNQEQVYVMGRSSQGCWAGVELSSRFTYNP